MYDWNFINWINVDSLIYLYTHPFQILGRDFWTWVPYPTTLSWLIKLAVAFAITTIKLILLTNLYKFKICPKNWSESQFHISWFIIVSDLLKNSLHLEDRLQYTYTLISNYLYTQSMNIKLRLQHQIMTTSFNLPYYTTSPLRRQLKHPKNLFGTYPVERNFAAASSSFSIRSPLLTSTSALFSSAALWTSATLFFIFSPYSPFFFSNLSCLLKPINSYSNTDTNSPIFLIICF